MFSLIITLIAIALVAALALATLYYGGPAFNQGADRAQASKVTSQGIQILGAMELYKAETGAYPLALTDLVSNNYLKSIPTAQVDSAEILSSALADSAASTWSLVTPGAPVIVLKPVSSGICSSFNLKMFGSERILQAPHEDQTNSCYGTDVASLTILMGKSAQDITYAAGTPSGSTLIGPVLNTPTPAANSTDTSINGWFNPSSTGVVTPPPPLANGLFYVTWGNGNLGSTPVNTAVYGEMELHNVDSTPITVQASTSGQGFSVSYNDCVDVAPGDYCYVSVRFAPKAQTSHTGTLLVETGDTSHSISLTGVGSAPELQTQDSVGTPYSSLTLPAGFVGISTLPTWVYVKNTGISNVYIGSAAVTGDFIVLNDQCDGRILALGESCQIEINAQHTALGVSLGELLVGSSRGELVTTLTATTNAAPSGLAIVQNGAPVSLLQFPDMVFADNFATVQNVTLVNNTGMTLTNLNLGAPGYAGTTDFSWDGATTDCAYVGSLSQGQTCSIGYVYDPIVLGLVSSLITVTTAEGPQATVTLQGTAN
jgi:type II secretory pathway pseudopilin PulG